MTAGKIAWTDLTVPDAAPIRDFYAAVVGWRAEEIPVEDHTDYAMFAPDAEAPAGGICNALPPNTGLPVAWLVYITVDDLDASLAEVRARGGEVVSGPRSESESRFAVIRDPAGAYCALWQEG
jgi:predicted enzyme related to lactoylglutathione lyase